MTKAVDGIRGGPGTGHRRISKPPGDARGRAAGAGSRAEDCPRPSDRERGAVPRARSPRSPAPRDAREALKRPRQLPVSALEFGRLFEKAGFPPGVVNIVTGFGSELGERLVTHPDVAKIAFTGGDRTGQGVYELAARSIKPVTLELRGKSANIVFKDAALGTPGAGAGHSRSRSLLDHSDERQGACNRRRLRQ